jgi:hypothetical protein
MKRDERSITEQVKSGFRIVGAILASFAAFLVFSVGYSYVARPEQQRIVTGWIILVATVTIMFVTVRFWANWFCGIVSYVAVRSIVLLVLVLVGGVHASPWYVAGFCALAWLLALLSIHLYRRRHFSILDHVGLTGGATCLFLGILRMATTGSTNAGLIPLVIAVALLLPTAFEKSLTRLTERTSS